MSNLSRKKITLDDDPLSQMLMGGVDDDDRESIDHTAKPVVSKPNPASAPAPAPVSAKALAPVPSQVPAPLPAAALPVDVKSKTSSLFGDDPSPARKASLFGDSTSSVKDSLFGDLEPLPTPKSAATPMPAASVAKEDPVVVDRKPAESSTVLTNQTKIFDEEDIFSAKPITPPVVPTTRVTDSSSISPKPSIAKIDFNKDEDDISDLNVTRLLEKEDNLDFKLFGRTETAAVQKEKVQQRLNDLDKEDDFLRQIDELTQKASLSPKASSSTATVNVVSSSTPSTTVTTDIDIASLDLSAYIAQESSNSGGLFDD